MMAYFMTRRRFYAPPIAFSDGAQSVTLNADETRHLRDVLRLRLGDEAYIFDGEGREFRGVVDAIERNSSVLRIIGEVEPASTESPLNLTLAVALLKGEKFDVVVQKATELGVSCLMPVITSRADVRIHNPDDAQKKETRWQRIALEAAKQCGRAKLMKVELPISFTSVVSRANSGEARLMFSEREGVSLAKAIDPVEEPPSTIAIVGAEGGWTDEEIELARAAGWKIVTLGGRTLRAETAAVTVAVLLQHRFGDLN